MVGDPVRNGLIRILPLVDLALAPFVYITAWLHKFVRRVGVHRLPKCRSALIAVGVFPIRRHYYEPQFDIRDATQPLARDRLLPGIDWNLSGQLQLLDSLVFARELEGIPHGKVGALEFHFDNATFESGDAEYWYQLIRLMKPRRLFEIGSGNSTLMARRAIERNRVDDPGYACTHVCIEPYEMPWLERTGVSVLRKRVEQVDLAYFSRLQDGDILFIDSSHVIRPQGDVLFEYLQLIPTLAKGVIVHVHDVFSPRNYPREWIELEVKFWNEQYLLEAFLTHNESWEVIGALNYLHHNHYARLKAVAPYLTPEREPGSFYLRRIR